MSVGSDTVAIQNWLQRLADGDESAREQLIQSAENRLLCRLAKNVAHVSNGSTMGTD